MTFFSFLGWGEVESTCNQHRMIDYDECGAVGGMRIGRGNRNTRRKPVPVPLWPSEIPHDLTWTRTRAAAVGPQRLIAWAMSRPYSWLGIAITSFVVIHPLHGCHAVSMFQTTVDEITHKICIPNCHEKWEIDQQTLMQFWPSSGEAIPVPM
jgi:hypothetical protein